MDSFSYGFDKKGSSRIGAGFILFCLFVAFMLAAIPLPSWMESWRPCWVALLVFYFVVNYPQKYGVFLSFVTGIFLDVFNEEVKKNSHGDYQPLQLKNIQKDC